MNVMVDYRANGFGTIPPSTAERLAVSEQLNATAKAQSGATVLAAKQAGQTTADAPADASLPTNDLGEDEFLQLLLTQSRNQDPLEPMDNTEMIAQLAQFATLEQSEISNSNLEQLLTGIETVAGNIDQLNFLSAQGMLDRYVTGIDLDGDEVEGYVRSVTLDGSIVILNVDGEPLPMTGVLGVGDSPENTPGASGYVPPDAEEVEEAQP